MKMPRDGFDLAAELRALRPDPTEPFATELDRRAAAGFPLSASPQQSTWDRLTARIRAASPRQFALPAGAVALAVLVIATAVIATGENGGAPASPRKVANTGKLRGRSFNASAHLGGRLLEGSPGGRHSGSPAAAEAESSLSGGAASAVGATAGFRYSAAPFLVGGRHRNVEHDAELTLLAQPGEIDDASEQVFSAVHAANGVVLSSSVQSQKANASAVFELLLPSARLSDALASLSQIADVRSRHESTLDITAPTVGVGERLQDSRARIDGLLAQLAGAEGDGERVEVEAALRSERRNAAALRSHLDRLQHRATFSHVSLRVESDADAGEAASGRWNVGDALDDAARILTIAAGVIVLALAVVGPLALILLLAWLARRVWLRRRRESALS